MPTRRYYIAVLPIEHINGKMDQVSNIVHNTESPPIEPVDGFWYGYRPRWASRSYYGIRRNPRNLTTNPYTPAEIDNRTLFTISLESVHQAWTDPAKRQRCQDEFYHNHQTSCKTVQGYAVSETHRNGGVWPSRWD